MREIRIFELEQDEPATRWQAAQPLVVKALAGQLWLTVEGDDADHWLAPGESFDLPRGAAAWVSAGSETARMALAVGYTNAAEPAVARASAVQGGAVRAAVAQWLPRWLQAA